MQQVRAVAGRERGRGRVPAESGRYLAVGAACALANNAILIGGAAAGLHYMACIALSAAIVLPASYPAHACWTFRAPLSWAGFGRYVLGSLSSVAMASLMVALLCGPPGLGLPMPIAAPAATVAMLFYNFVMTRWAVRHRPTAA